MSTDGRVEYEAIIRRFARAWAGGERPGLNEYHVGGRPWSRHLLVELVHLDLEFRIEAGEPARVEDYLAHSPELAADGHALLGLLRAEHDLRQRLRGDIAPGEYRRRFPEMPWQLPGEGVAQEGDTAVAWMGPPPPEGQATPAVPGYEVVEKLGRGGMGVVYKARDLSLGREVALKFLPAEFAHDQDRLERFRREARTASALNHPHICTVHALGDHRGRPFIVMELIDGSTLQALAASRPPVEEVARLLAQAARALAAAHEAGVVHRDIKPENIMARPDGFVKVVDFGLARRLPALGRPGANDTDPGTLLGTVAYMSPEQARGEPVGPASDVFSLGTILYQLVAGRHPFQAESPLGYLHSITTDRPPPPSRLSQQATAALDGLVEAMLSKEAALRPTAAEVAAALAGPAGRRAEAARATRPLVRRERELAALRAALADADAGRGCVLCLSGEPGIGKTSLVEDFLSGLEAPGAPCLVGRGHCSERLAEAEAYLPVIEALGGLLRGASGATVARLMRAVAPTWHAQASPWAAGEGARAPSGPAMLREFSGLLQELSRLGTAVLFLDDVHWADVPTVDLLAHVGRACPSMRLLVLATYRPTELLLGPHPFRGVMHELQGRGACREVALGFLRLQEVERYLELAFPGHAFHEGFAGLLHSRTEGSPLFLDGLLRDARERGVIAEQDGHWVLAREVTGLGRELPESVRGMVRRKLERLDEGGRRLLSAAAVQGPEFDTAALAGALGLDAADVEEGLQRLDRVHGLVRLAREAELPGGALSLRYAFVHVLYQEALVNDLSPTRRAALAAALARAIEGQRPGGAEAAQLACLYETGRDFARAARYFCQAATNAARVYAHREAAELARRGLWLLEAVPAGPERDALELPLQMALGLQLQVTSGYAAPEATKAYERARALCPRQPEAPLFPVLWGLWLAAKVRSELSQARRLADELHALALERNGPDLALQAQQALAVTTLCLGEPASTVRHMEQGATLYDPERHRAHSHQFGQDPGVACKAFGAVALWLTGHPQEAVAVSDDCVRLSQRLSQPSSQALALHFAAMVHQLRGGPGRARQCAEACGALASEHGLSFWKAGSEVMAGWALAASGAGEEGVARMRRGLRDWDATGSVTYRTYYMGLLAEVLAGSGRDEEARAVLEEGLALAERTGEGLYLAELHRLRGELAARAGEVGRAREELARAVEVARRQEARGPEARAEAALRRLGEGH